jgi:hypothetical protein
MELLWAFLEAVVVIVGSAGAATAAVRRFMSGGFGQVLSDALKKSVDEALAAERPKLLEALRSELRTLVLEETEAERQKLAHLVGRLDTLERVMLRADTAEEVKRHG